MCCLNIKAGGSEDFIPITWQQYIVKQRNR
jgi:hypothetical protein